MVDYVKTKVPELISVGSIVTIFHSDLTGRKSRGEYHDFWEFLYVESGTQNVTVNDVSYTLGEGQMIFYAPMSFHEILEKCEAKVNIVSFESASAAMSYFENRVITLSHDQRSLLTKVMKSGSICFEKAAPETGVKGMVPKENATPYDFQNLKNSLELLLIDLYEASKSNSAETGRSNYENRDKNIFDEITQFLQKNLYTSLTLGDICRECAVSPFLLKRVCKSQCGMSPMSYFTSLKLGAAKQMICDTDMNFTQISEMLGFSSVHYFSKLFKDKTGVSPSEYAKTVWKR